jgi:hypothetical protein
MDEAKRSKFEIRPLTLDDKLIKDGLEAVGQLKSVPLCIVGGIAVQSYLPTACRRPTSDIDMSIGMPLNYEAFREMAKPVIEFLQDHQYTTSTEKASRNFKICVQNQQAPEDKLVIESSRRNENNYEANRVRLEREIANAKVKTLEERKTSYVVAAPEDIAIPKIVRGVGAMSRNPALRKYARKERIPLSPEIIQRLLAEISELRAEVMMSPADPELTEELRFFSDIYDVRILSETAGFNPSYFALAFKEWNTLTTPGEDKEYLLASVLPVDLIEKIREAK